MTFPTNQDPMPRLPAPSVVAARKLAAKRNNERVKLASSSMNTIGLAILGAAFVVPGVVDLANVRWVWIPAAVALHLGAHVALMFLKSED